MLIYTFSLLSLRITASVVALLHKKRSFEKNSLRVVLLLGLLESFPGVTKRGRERPGGQVSGPPEGTNNQLHVLLFGLWEMNLKPSVMSENVACLIFYYSTSVLLQFQS